MLHYVFQTIIFQLIFLLAYDLFLKNETFFNYNRLYLLATSIFSLVLPLIKIDGFSQIIPNDYRFILPEIILGNTNNAGVISDVTAQTEAAVTSFFTISNFYFLMVIIAFVFFLIKLTKLLSLAYKNKKTKAGRLTIIHLKNSHVAYSFFNLIFLDTALSKIEKDNILKHESIHAREKHSLDLLWFEILKIVFWFNPLIYLYQNRTSNLHEYIADSKAVKKDNTYYQQLLQQIFSVKNVSFVNPFFKKSLIKKRIIMLQKSKSKPAKLAKYLMLIPILFAMVIYTSCEESKSESKTNEVAEIVEGEEIPYYVNRVKEQIEIQGNISDNEEKALDLLLKVVKGKEFDPNLVEQVANLIKKEDKSKLEQRLSALFNIIQIKGNITKEDDNALADLLILTSDNGFNDPFFKDALNRVEIPFGVVQKTPVFPGCDTDTEEENKKCFSNAITKHVFKNFNTALADNLGLEKGLIRIIVNFKIDKKGDVIKIETKAPHPDLEAEVKRVINSLPKMTPGMHEGKAVDVGYGLPISFHIK